LAFREWVPSERAHVAAPERSSGEERLKLSVARDPSADRTRPQANSGTFFKPKSPTREVLVLAWPIAAAMLGETAIGLVDTKLVGGLGASALGGVGLGTTIMFLGYSVVFGLMRGVKIATAHAIGEGRARDGFAYAQAGLVLGFALGLVQLAVCRDVSPLLSALGADPAIIPYARDFLAAITLGAPATCALAALIQHRQAIGDSRTPMIVGIAGNLFNASFAWALIYGRLGFPALGVKGGGYATAITETLELSAMLWLLYREQRTVTAQPSLDLRKAIREVVTIGGPTGVQFAFEMTAFTMFTIILGSIDAREIAAHQIALATIRVSFLPGVAVAEAASVLVGQSLGKRDTTGANEVTKSALKIAVGFMAICGLFFALGGGLVAEFFSNDATVGAITRKLLLVAAVFQVLDAVNIVLRGALRGAKDVRLVMLIGVGSVWLCIPTAAWFLGRQAGLGSLGGWLGFVAETTIGAGLFWLRWKHGGWRARYRAVS
jgi:multidrug resistance protein, MATE family